MSKGEPMSSGSVLETEEIAALMAGSEASERAAALFAALPPLKKPEKIEPFRYDQGDLDGPSRYPLLVSLHDRLAEVLQGHWGDQFRREIPARFIGMKSQLYEKIADEELQQVYFTLEAKEFGRMMVTVDIPLIVVIVDAMLGGEGSFFDKDQPQLSPVEFRLCDYIGKDLRELVIKAWQPFRHYAFSLLRLDTNPQFNPLAGSKDNCFSAEYRISMSENLEGLICFHYPRAVLEPLLEQMRGAANEKQPIVDQEWQQHLNEAIDAMPLTVRLEMGSCRLDFGRFLALKAGDLLPLNKREGDPATLWIEGIPMFQAVPGQQNGMLAAEIVQKNASGGRS